jgi:light-regulated signal transduction histidine kinase (bacteriophytochrome)
LKQLLQESLKGKLGEDEEENFAFMIDGATRMQQMIDALLTYSRVTTKAKPAKRVDLNETIADLKSVELAVPTIAKPDWKRVKVSSRGNSAGDYDSEQARE